MSFKIHYLVEDPQGPIVSAPGGTTFKVGRHARHSVACDPKIELNEFHRGTGEIQHVVCNACAATEAFKKVAAKWPFKDEKGKLLNPRAMEFDEAEA
jgi:hypothetical protein